jgi:hypothetical protein
LNDYFGFGTVNQTALDLLHVTAGSGDQQFIWAHGPNVKERDGIIKFLVTGERITDEFTFDPFTNPGDAFPGLSGYNITAPLRGFDPIDGNATLAREIVLKSREFCTATAKFTEPGDGGPLLKISNKARFLATNGTFPMVFEDSNFDASFDTSQLATLSNQTGKPNDGVCQKSESGEGAVFMCIAPQEGRTLGAKSMCANGLTSAYVRSGVMPYCRDAFTEVIGIRGNSSCTTLLSDDGQGAVSRLAEN